MKPSPYHLFHGYGVELEYMLVNKDTLEVMPVVDDLLKYELGEIGSDFENGMITWSNELVLHVIELKSTKPENDLDALEKAFTRNISRINAILDEWNAMLLPSAAHPFMDPFKETRLWPHDNNDVYELYNKIFNCSGHGWSNLQSTHLNLPFTGDEEFAKLHAAIRLLLPLLPVLCASSPLLDSKLTGMLDSRLHYYKANQAKIPSITGLFIPEAVFSHDDYKRQIYSKIEKDLLEFNQGNILDPVWVNSRGAIARFDRGSIEIRIMDIQECPAADLAIVNTVVQLLKALVEEKFCNLNVQMKMDTQMLSGMLDQIAIHGGQTRIENQDYLAAFGLSSPMTAKAVWKHLLSEIPANIYYDKKSREIIHTILDNGSLAERIIRSLNEDYSLENIKIVYTRLSKCLSENTMFIS